MGIKSKVLSEDEMLDLGLLAAMKEGRKSGKDSMEEIDKKLNHWRCSAKEIWFIHNSLIVWFYEIRTVEDQL